MFKPVYEKKLKEKEVVEQYFMVECVNVNMIEMHNTFEQGEKFVSLIIEDITELVKEQQNLSDEMYQDAIECNYSHE
jgi:hypothetical protein